MEEDDPDHVRVIERKVNSRKRTYRLHYNWIEVIEGSGKQKYHNYGG